MPGYFNSLRLHHNRIAGGIAIGRAATGEAKLLQAAAAFEDVLGLADRVPILPNVTHLALVAEDERT